MKSAAAYIRVSTDDQTEYSPDAQLRAIKDYCAKNDYYLDADNVFIDEGKSGRKAEKRPAFMKMIGAAKSKPAPFEVILCHKFDRFARNRQDSVVYKSLLQKECGVKVISITESIDNDKISLIMESMLEAMAEYYSINLSEEVKKGMTEKAMRGEPLSVAPFGYRVENKQLVIVPDEAELVKVIFDDFIAGKPYLKIAKECNEKGFRSHRGGMFENRTIDYIIHNPAYMGYIRWTPTERARRNFNHPDTMIVQGTHEPIVSAQIFEQAAKQAQKIKALHRPYYKPQYKPSHWLVGLLRCCNCGGAMVNSGGYFVCNNNVRGICPTRNGIKVEKLADMVEKTIVHDFIHSEMIKIVSVVNSDKNSEIENQIAEINLRLARVKDAYERGIDTIDEYETNKSRLTAELNVLKNKIGNKKTSVDKESVLHKIQDFLTCDADDKPEKAKEFIKQIVFNKEDQGIAITYYAG